MNERGWPDGLAPLALSIECADWRGLAGPPVPKRSARLGLTIRSGITGSVWSLKAKHGYAVFLLSIW